MPFNEPFVCFLGVLGVVAFVFSVVTCPLFESVSDEVGESVNQEATQPVSPDAVVTWFVLFSVFFIVNDSLFSQLPIMLSCVLGPLRMRTPLAFTSFRFLSCNVCSSHIFCVRAELPE